MRNIFLALMALISHAPLPAQDCGTVVKHIDLGGDERVWASSKGKDSSVYLAGGISRGFGTEALFLVKTTTSGDVLWSRVIPGGSFEFLRSVAATSDSGAITVGVSKNYPASSSGSAIVIKWDKNGTRQWSRAFRTNSINPDYANGVIQTSDGGYLITGSQNAGGYTSKGLAIKIASNGTAQWIKLYDAPEGTDMFTAVEVADGFVIAGDYLTNSNTTYRACVAKVSKANGDLVSLKSWNLPDNSILNYGFIKAKSDGFYVSCTNLSTLNTLGNMKQVVLYLDQALDVTRTVRVGHGVSKNATLPEIDVMPDGSFVSGTGGDNSNNDADMYQISSSGTVLWRTRIGGTGAQQLFGTTALNSQDVVFTGANTNTFGEKNILWVRNALGTPTTSCDMQASDAAVETLATSVIGFQYDAVTNGNLSDWVSVNPAIEFDSHTTVFSCGSVCAPPEVCGNNWLNAPNLYDGAFTGDLDVTGQQITVEGLFNRTAPYVFGQDAVDIVSKHDRPADVNYLLRESGASITTTNGFFFTPPACPIQANRTYHVAMVYDGSFLKFYRNGELLSQVAATGDLITNSYPLTIGDKAGFKPANETVRGYINEVRIWNVIRSQTDIKNNMFQSLPNPPSQTGLLAYYVFNNLQNKQGNATWNLNLQGSASIANPNPNCILTPENCPSLPLQLKDLQVSLATNKATALITFTTFNELNVETIQIEKSVDAQNYFVIGSLKPRGDKLNKYQFADSNVRATEKSIHYRVSVNDKDGRVSKSRVVLLSLSQARGQIMRLQPNPTSSHAQLFVAIDTKEQISTIFIRDVAGRIVSKQNATLFKGNNVIDLNGISNLQNGVYLVTMLVDGQLISDRLLVSKQ
jgi:hypothetical protein